MPTRTLTVTVSDWVSDNADDNAYGKKSYKYSDYNLQLSDADADAYSDGDGDSHSDCDNNFLTPTPMRTVTPKEKKYYEYSDYSFLLYDAGKDSHGETHNGNVDAHADARNLGVHCDIYKGLQIVPNSFLFLLCIP